MSNKPRIENISKKYETLGIELIWANTNLTTGSVLVYRADNGKLGTYSIVGSDGIPDNLYLDIAGSEDSWYKIQTWDSVGSSPFSDPASIERFNYLCTDQEVRDILRLSANQDEIGSLEIENAILDAQSEVLGEYGNPIKRTYTYLSNDIGSYYWIKENKEPIYKLDRIEFDKTRLPVGSYTIDLNTGIVTFADGFVNSNQSEIVQFEWTPKVFNLLAKNMAALLLLDDFMIKDGDTITNPKMVILKDRITRYRTNMADASIAIMSSQYADYDERKPTFIDQPTDKDYFV